jgi:hypothetical protein
MPEPIEQATDAELERTRLEIARLQAELGVSEPAPEPEPVAAGATGGGGGAAAGDFGWVTYAQCTKERRIGEGAGCKGVFKLCHPGTGEAPGRNR